MKQIDPKNPTNKTDAESNQKLPLQEAAPKNKEIKPKAPMLRSYGRRRARSLSQAQQKVLNESEYQISIPPEITEPLEFFKSLNTQKIILEIGFGTGEHLIKNALKNPSIAFIGCEPFENGAAAALRAIELHNIKNIRIFKGDARELLEKLSHKSFFRIYVLFPDPWPKKRHHSRRLLSSSFIKFLFTKLEDFGSLNIASDSDDYIKEILKNMDVNEDIQKFAPHPNCFLGTKYERKAIEKHKTCYYLRFYNQIKTAN